MSGASKKQASMAMIALLAAAGMRKILAPRASHDPHTGDLCPKCKRYRVWISGETLRCRDCGHRFIPDDLPPLEEDLRVRELTQ